MRPDGEDASAKSDMAAIWDMLEAAKDVVTFVKGRTLDHYGHDRMLQAAVERKIEIIGEAARNVSDAFQAAHPEIPWKPIMAQRHIIAHDYGEIIDEKIWKVATFYVPQVDRSSNAVAAPGTLTC